MIIQYDYSTSLIVVFSLITLILNKPFILYLLFLILHSFYMSTNCQLKYDCPLLKYERIKTL